MRRVIVSGWRGWPDTHATIVTDALWTDFLLAGVPTVYVHGAAPGVDDIVQRWTLATRSAPVPPPIFPEPHSANWALWGDDAGGVRNQRMVNARAERVYAFPHPKLSRGTRDLVRRAGILDVPIHVIEFPA